MVEDSDGPYRVMIVDDSSLARAFLVRLLAEHEDVDVVGAAMSGPQGLRYLGSANVEIVLLDVEMPEAGGLQLLPRLLLAQPDLKIIMVSALTTEHAGISIAALTMGASDYVAKPDPEIAEDVERFHRDLIEKIRQLGTATRRRRAAVASAVQEHITPPPEPVEDGRHYHVHGTNFRLKEYPNVQRMDALAIVASTGGPRALVQLFNAFDGEPPAYPIFVTQHMPGAFTQSFAEHICKSSGLSCVVATDGEVVQAGMIYLAPGDYHLGVSKERTCPLIKLLDGPAENYCKPSADPMLRSLAACYRSGLIVIVLTGMGSDGLKGARQVVSEGGMVVAQDEASSTVWGMPGSVVSDGLCSDVMGLVAMTEWLKQMERGRSRGYSTS